MYMAGSGLVSVSTPGFKSDSIRSVFDQQSKDVYCPHGILQQTTFQMTCCNQSGVLCRFNHPSTQLKQKFKITYVLNNRRRNMHSLLSTDPPAKCRFN